VRKFQLILARVMAESSDEVGTSVTLTTLSGGIVLDMSPAPATIADVKVAVCESAGVPLALQKILLGDVLLEDTCKLDKASANLTFILDESPLFSWDITSNPEGKLLSGMGGDVCYSTGTYDYVNVITQEPVRRGFHYFEFVMHKIGDEQWCGVTLQKERAGRMGGSIPGWFYYCGRRFEEEGEFTVNHERNRVKKFEHVRDGDVIGMMLDADEGILVFTLNGRLQGAGEVPKEPLYLTTCLDREEDRVELRKPPLQDSPLDLTAVRNLSLDYTISSDSRPTQRSSPEVEHLLNSSSGSESSLAPPLTPSTD